MTVALSRALLAAVAALDDWGIRYAVVGGLAVGAWGVSRSTRDADLYAELPSDGRSLLQRALEEAGFEVRGCGRSDLAGELMQSAEPRSSLVAGPTLLGLRVDLRQES
jgi:hypothetical protein